MKPDRWKEVSRIYGAVVARPADERVAAMAALCANDPDLRRAVESLLDESAQGAHVLDRPPFVAGDVLSPLHLPPGTAIGVYRIVDLLGVGGMGEVYRARDTKLNRDVAIKILPAAVASDPDRLARFKREAQVLASLNHPNIGGIYGFEDGGNLHALVLELVEGPTLADMLDAASPRAQSREPRALSVSQALAIARQVATALEAAHEQGIIHRDLKPANIKVRDDGTVKVLDFGLAKPMETDPSSGASDHSPTITSPAMTQAGIILGTAAYMSPEQAKGRPLDKRSDVWSFGAVLYEMLCGRRAFKGEDIADTIAAVLREEIDWTALPVTTPPAVRRLLTRCLTRDVRNRLRDIGEARILLADPVSTTARIEVPAESASLSRPARHVIALAAGALVVGAVAAVGALWLGTRPPTPRIVRTAINTSGSAALSVQGGDHDLAVTSDGSRVVYRADNALVVRALEQLDPAVLSGLGSARNPFLSPDEQWVGYFNGLTIKKVAITGGPPEMITSIDGPPRGATWGPDGTIIFATDAPLTGLQRISQTGNDLTVLTRADRVRGEADHRWPEFLPGGQAVLFTITRLNEGIDSAQIAVLDLATGTSKVLAPGSDAHYTSTGHLVYTAGGVLRAVAFDLRLLEVVGPSLPVLDGVWTSFLGAANIAIAANGTLVYAPGPSGGSQQTVVSVDRQGNASPLRGLPDDLYRDVRISPDGKRIALATQTDIWTYDFANASRSKLTTRAAADHSPLWTLDSHAIIFTSTRAGYPELIRRSADGTGSDEPVVAGAADHRDLIAAGWSHDGTHLLLTEVPLGPSVIKQIEYARPSETRTLVNTGFSDADAAVSPKGGWIAYRSGDSGPSNIYVQRYPELGDRKLISPAGGRGPIWSHDGKELFFISLSGRQMMAVSVPLSVPAGTSWIPESPRPLFELVIAPLIRGFRRYDVTDDGRFVVIRGSGTEEAADTTSSLIVVQNWFEELKRLVPSK